MVCNNNVIYTRTLHIPFHLKICVCRRSYLQGPPSAGWGGIRKVWLEQIIALPQAMALAPFQQTCMGGQQGHCFTYVIIPWGGGSLVIQFIAALHMHAITLQRQLGFFLGCILYISKDNRKKKNVALK